MGKTNKKRKYIKKVSRKPKKAIPKFAYPQQPELQRLWDANKTLKQNMAAIGLAVNPNTSKSMKPKQSGIQEGDRVLGVSEPVAEGNDSQPVLEVPESKGPIEKRISRSKVDYYMPLIRKYGSDYEKMFRDIKLNYEQMTARQLQKNCEWLIETLAKQEAELKASERQQKKAKSGSKETAGPDENTELPEDFPALEDPDIEEEDEAEEDEEEEEEDGDE